MEGEAPLDAAERCLRDAGFASLEVESLDVGLPVRGGVAVEEAAAFMSAMGPVARALGEAGESQREPVQRAIAEAMRPFETDAGVVLGASAWLVSARGQG